MKQLHILTVFVMLTDILQKDPKKVISFCTSNRLPKYKLRACLRLRIILVGLVPCLLEQGTWCRAIFSETSRPVIQVKSQHLQRMEFTELCFEVQRCPDLTNVEIHQVPIRCLWKSVNICPALHLFGPSGLPTAEAAQASSQSAASGAGWPTP